MIVIYEIIRAVKIGYVQFENLRFLFTVKYIREKFF